MASAAPAFDRPYVAEGPSRRWYLVAAALAGAGIGVIAWCVATFVGQVQSGAGIFELVRFTAPGEVTFSADEPGTYNLYTSRQDYGRRWAPSDWDVRVTSAADGQTLPAHVPRGSHTLTINQEEFESIRQIRVPRQGAYRVRVICDEPHARAPMAVGPWNVDQFLGFVGRIALIPVTMLFGGGGALAIFLVTLLKRRSARKRAAERAGAPVSPYARPAPPDTGSRSPFPPAPPRA
ncbi:MAG: hypothetical protein KGY99_03740 [Phycisphaerae bacterium]|nr:hypothetical protein [Phycisphaerae bacterium]